MAMQPYTEADVAFWRQKAIDEATPHGLQDEVAEAYDGYVRTGDEPPRAHWCALYDWDI